MPESPTSPPPSEERSPSSSASGCSNVDSFAPPLMDQRTGAPAVMTLEQIYDHEADFVWRMLGRVGAHEGELRATLQEGFLAVHRNLPRFEWRFSLTTWLFTVCRSVA